MMQEALESLIEAINSGRTDIVKSVLDACEQCENNDEGGITVDTLLNSQSTQHGTVLHLATQVFSYRNNEEELEDADIVRALLSAGADPGIHNEGGQTPYDLALTEKVKNVFTEELLQCTAQSNVGRVCQLIAAGVDVNSRDSEDSQNTPLHWAASYGNRDIVQCLVDRNADVNATNAEGAVPLHDAIYHEKVDVVEELILSGADPEIIATSGKYYNSSCLDLAADKPEIVKLLRKTADMPNGDLQDDISTNDHEDINLTVEKPASIAESVSSLTTESPQIPNGPMTDQPTAIVSEPVTPPAIPTLERLSGLIADGTVASPLTPLVTDTRLHLLWPLPQKVIQKEGKPFIPEKVLNVLIQDGPQKGLLHEVAGLWRDRTPMLEAMDMQLNVSLLSMQQSQLGEPYIISQVNERLFSSKESYKITVFHKQVKVLASDAAGMFQGINTFMQLLRFCHKDGLPQVQIDDWPSVKNRGFLMDLSKGRIPKEENMFDLVHTLGLMKMNELQLYMRFNRADTPEWQFPYSRSFVLELERFCMAHFIRLTPVIDVNPGVTFEDMGDLYPVFRDFLNCFTVASFVAAGPRLSSFLVDINDDSVMSIEDMDRLIPLASHQTLQMCGYVFHDSSDVLSTCPPNMVLAEYGFQAMSDFEKNCRIYAESSIPFYVLPGTGAWNSIAGCPEAAVNNICRAIQCSSSHTALGLVVCQWAGVSHITHQCICWPGIMAAAGLAWNSNITQDFVMANLSQMIDTHVLMDEAEVTGQVIIELGRAETFVMRCARGQSSTDMSNLPAEKGSTLYQLLSHPDQVSLENLTADVFQRAVRHIRKCQEDLRRASLKCYRGDEMVQELQLTIDMMLGACRIGRTLVNTGRNPTGPNGRMGYAVINIGVSNLTTNAKTDLANRFLGLITRYKQVWTSVNMDTGLSDSLQFLQTLLKQFVPESQAAHLEEEIAS